MHANATQPVFPADLRGATLSSYTTVADDGTLCFVSDKVYRGCPACGTVFAGSASRAVFGDATACPFCGQPGSEPLPTGRLS